MFFLFGESFLNSGYKFDHLGRNKIYAFTGFSLIISRLWGFLIFLLKIMGRYFIRKLTPDNPLSGLKNTVGKFSLLSHCF